jgi:bifunctional non-homologous end joining protein LigD
VCESRLPVPAASTKVKHDGFRILAQRDSADVRLITRAGNEFSHRFPFLAMAVGKLPVRSCLIDGEAVLGYPGGRGRRGSHRD